MKIQKFVWHLHEIIVKNSLQNNLKVQCKFTKQVGISVLLDTLDKETVEKPMIRKFGAISSSIRGFLIMRKQFYELNGIQRLLQACAKFPVLYYRFCWLIGAILDENKPTDKAEFQFSKNGFITSIKSLR